jgi:hypothetical protein
MPGDRPGRNAFQAAQARGPVAVSGMSSASARRQADDEPVISLPAHYAANTRLATGERCRVGRGDGMMVKRRQGTREV